MRSREVTALVGALPATEVATVRGFTKRYGRRLAVDFVARLRDEVHFPDLEAMRQQMLQDARQARALLGH